MRICLALSHFPRLFLSLFIHHHTPSPLPSLVLFHFLFSFLFFFCFVLFSRQSCDARQKCSGTYTRGVTQQAIICRWKYLRGISCRCIVRFANARRYQSGLFASSADFHQSAAIARANLSRASFVDYILLGKIAQIRIARVSSDKRELK